MHTTHNAWHTGDSFYVAGSSRMVLLTAHVVRKTGHLNRCVVDGRLFYNKPDHPGLSPSLATYELYDGPIVQSVSCLHLLYKMRAVTVSIILVLL